MFVFEIIKEMDHPTEQQLLDEELNYINKLLPQYNVGSVGGGDNLTNNPDRDDIIRRMTETIRARVAKMSEDERKRIWSQPGDKNPNWKGGISSPKCDGCGKVLLYGHKKCSRCSKIGSNNPFYGKHHSEKSRKYLSDIRKGKLPANTNPIVLNGVSYISQADAARKLGVSIGSISNWVRGKFKQRPGTLSQDVNYTQVV